MTASQLEGALCVEGVLLDGDQDLLIWELPASQASTLWRIEVDGMPGVLTSLKVFGITSEPGVEPIVASGAPILDVGKDPGQEDPSTQDGILLPVGRYLLGISRSDIQDGRPDSDATYRYTIRPSDELPPPGDLEPM
jgi:hypothetical protein